MRQAQSTSPHAALLADGRPINILIASRAEMFASSWPARNRKPQQNGAGAARSNLAVEMRAQLIPVWPEVKYSSLPSRAENRRSRPTCNWIYTPPRILAGVLRHPILPLGFTLSIILRRRERETERERALDTRLVVRLTFRSISRCL